MARAKAVQSPSYPVMVSRWKPQLLEVSPVVELMVPYDKKDQVVALKKQIAAHFRVPFAEIRLSDVSLRLCHGCCLEMNETSTFIFGALG